MKIYLAIVGNQEEEYVWGAFYSKEKAEIFLCNQYIPQSEDMANDMDDGYDCEVYCVTIDQPNDPKFGRLTWMAIEEYEVQ